MRLLALPLIAALSLACASGSAAAPFSLPFGDTRIAFDVPPGFTDTVPTGSPRLAEFAESLTSASNRILIFALTDADMRRFGVGDPPDLRRYLLASTPRALERDRVDARRFAALVDAELAASGKPPAGDAMKALEGLRAGQGMQLAELRRTPTEVSVLQGVRLPPGRWLEKQPEFMLSTTSLLHVRGRAINVAVFTIFESQADLDWIRNTTLRWIDELQRLNGR